MTRIIVSVLATIAALTLMAPRAAGEDTAKGPSQNIVEIAVADGRFTTLVGAVTQAGLAETLSGPGPFTVFAPTDEAFAKLPEGTLAGLSDEQLTAILTYHVVPGRHPAAQVVGKDGQSVPTVNGAELPVAVEDGMVFVGGAKVIITDIKGTNGIIHVVDSVIIPE